MNREILFTGFHRDESGTATIILNGEKIKGEWVYGDLIHRQIWASALTIIRETDDGFDNYEEYEVLPETVREYVNLMDRDFSKIFNGDLLKDENDKIWLMTYARGWWSYQIVSQNTKVQHHCTIHPITRTNIGDYLPSVKIVGNKWGNPELIKD